MSALGQSVVCSCGQRNDLAVFAYGEARLCLACGQALSAPGRELLEDDFVAEVPPGAFSESVLPSSGGTTGFESPSAESDGVGTEAATAIATPERVWTGGVRELVDVNEEERCARCHRTFRGAWDQNPRASGILCHVCAVQADGAYQAPTPGERRDLFRPDPPKSVPQQGAATPDPAEWSRKMRGLTIIAACGVLTVLCVVFLPVEVWVAEFFSTDKSLAQDLPVAWQWVVHVAKFLVNLLAQATGLYVTLNIMGLLFDDRWESFKSVALLAVVFAFIDAATAIAGAFLAMFGPLVIGLYLIAFYAKLNLINGQFPLCLESGIRFVIAWFVCTLMLAPCMFMVEVMLGALVAAIAM